MSSTRKTALVTGVFFGLFKQTSGPSFILTLPEIAWELSLGVYLTVKGFRPSPITAGSRRPAEVDAPLPIA